jgi:nucleoside-diphosphate-sugar epimerase
MKVAITGAAGFLGGSLVKRWRSQGHEVLPLVRGLDERAPSGARALDAVLEAPDALRGMDVVVHAAAIRHRHGVDVRAYRASNVELVERLVRAAAGRVQRLVHVSSVGIYGFPSELPICETHPFAPRTLYSATKIEAEKLVRACAKKHDVDLVIVRPTIIYGPGDTNGMLDKMARMIRAGSYRVVGSGDNVLHHIYVDDIAHGIECAATSSEAAGDDFILAGPETITLKALSELVAETVGKRLPRLHVPIGLARAVAAVVDIAQYRGIAFAKPVGQGGREPPINDEKLDVMTLPIRFDASKAQRRIGFRPRVSYREGVPLALGVSA